MPLQRPEAHRESAVSQSRKFSTRAYYALVENFIIREVVQNTTFLLSE